MQKSLSRGDTKAVQAVDSRGTGKSADMKQVTSNNISEPPTKRRKIKATTVETAVMPEEVEEPVEPWAPDPDQVFRFMDLPGEVRNRIYEMAVEWSHRCFPMTYRKPKKCRRQKHSSDAEQRMPAVKPLPYIGLTQVCSLIRTEFRPLWLSIHRFPLFALEGYLKAFFPILRWTSRMDDKSLRRIKSYHDPTGTLRLWVKKNDMRDVDILPLLKFRLRFPTYTIDILSAEPKIWAPLIKFLTALINNGSSTWVKYIKQQSITQVIVHAEFYAGLLLRASLHIVIKEKQMSEWVEPGGHFKPLHCMELKRSLGVADLDVSFGVNYW